MSVEELRRYVAREVAALSTTGDGRALQHPTLHLDNPFSRLAFPLP
jgi:hypothetical protein